MWHKTIKLYLQVELFHEECWIDEVDPRLLVFIRFLVHYFRGFPPMRDHIVHGNTESRPRDHDQFVVPLQERQRSELPVIPVVSVNVVSHPPPRTSSVEVPQDPKLILIERGSVHPVEAAVSSVRRIEPCKESRCHENWWSTSKPSRSFWYHVPRSTRPRCEEVSTPTVKR